MIDPDCSAIKLECRPGSRPIAGSKNSISPWSRTSFELMIDPL
jgi:hypothetical protein